MGGCAQRTAKVLARCPWVSKHHRPVVMWPLFSVGTEPLWWSLRFEHLLMHLQSSEEKNNWEKVITIPPFTSSNISNESFLHDGTGSFKLHQVPEVACSTKTYKDGSNQQLSQEVLNTTKWVPDSAFPLPAMEGMAELQLSWVTGKQPVEILLSVHV